MESAVLATAMSVRLCVTLRYCVQKNEDTIVRFTASRRTIPLVSGEVKFIRRNGHYFVEFGSFRGQ